MPEFLLDTLAMLRIANGDQIGEPGAGALRGMDGPGAGLAVSPVTAWELAMLEQQGRIALSLAPGAWFERFCALPGVTLAEMPPSVLIASCALPGAPPADPVARILAATARANGYTIMARDRRLLDYGGAGHVRVLGC